MHIDRPGATEVVVPPDLLQENGPREDASWMLGEKFQELEFLERQVQGAPAQLRRVTGLIDVEIPCMDLFRVAGRTGRFWRSARDGQAQARFDLRRRGGVDENLVHAPVPLDRG